jgi:MOSC domain-containing protein YiiM
MQNDSEGLVLELFISCKDKTRKNSDEISVDIKGIQGDKFYDKDETRSILITALDSYTLAKESGIEANYGSLGENILVTINPYSLSQGDRLLIGEVELEITQNCTICNSLAKVDKKLPKVLKSDRGIFAKALMGGKIRKDDIVKVLKY